MTIDSFTLPHQCEVSGIVAAPVDQVFAFLDDPALLASHMRKPSWTMGGGAMTFALDAGQGRDPGSKMTLAGKAFGLPLSLEEIVVERSPPNRKVWETTGDPRLWVISHYRMGFDVKADARGSLATVFIEYALPSQGIGRWLGPLFGRAYARWCARRMLSDAQARFARHGAER